MKASRHGHINIVELLLNDSRVNPSDDENGAIEAASHEGRNEVIELLWQDKRVKNTLQRDCIDLYNKLMKQEVKNKVNEF